MQSSHHFTQIPSLTLVVDVLYSLQHNGIARACRRVRVWLPSRASHHAAYIIPSLRRSSRHCNMRCPIVFDAAR